MGDDIYLISPASRANEPVLPFGLLYVSSYLQKYGGMKAEILDLKCSSFRSMSEDIRDKLERIIIERVGQGKPGLVGITCLVTEVKEVLGLSKRIKRLVPDTKIVVGGIHPTMYPEDLIHEGSSVDYVVIGEGEETFTELAGAIKNGHSIQGIQDIQGIAWYDGQKVCMSPQRPSIPDLDTIPFPPYDQIDVGYYYCPRFSMIRNMYLSTAQIFTSRGCPVRCTFCVNKNLQKIMSSRKPFRQRSVNSVVDEIEYLSTRYAIDGFYICDDAFCIRKQFTFDFCEELRSRNLGLIWATETRVNLVSREIIKSMRDAGCVQIDFGVESGSPDVLKRMKKGISVEQVRMAFRWCHELGMRPMANFMFNTPGETEGDVQNTLALAREIDACYYNFNLMTPFPGTDIYNEVQPPLTVDEYSLLPKNYRAISDPRFKFAIHNYDLEKLCYETHTSFNTLWRRISFLFNVRYLKQLLKSKRKWEYVLTLPGVFSRFVDYYWAYIKFVLSNIRKISH